MRIGVDTRELMGRPTGVGRYLGELLREWADAQAGAAGRHEFLLYGPAAPSAASADVFAALAATLRVVPGSGRTWWEQVSLASAAAADRLDVFFAPAYTAPLRLGCPIATTIHDLSYFAHPEWFRARERFRRRLLTRQSARRSRIVLTDSAFSRGEIVRHLAVAEDRIRVVPLGVRAPVTPEVRDAAGPAAGMIGGRPPGGQHQPLILFVGSIFNRRHVPELLASFPAIAAAVPGARLEIIGENRTYPHQDLDAHVRATGHGARIQVRSYVSEAQLADAFRRASVFVFLSEYEGFGLTALEALACGIPVVLLDTPIAREVCGGAAKLIHAADPAAVAAAVVDVLRDPGARERARAESRDLPERYSWARAAHLTMDALELAAR